MQVLFGSYNGSTGNDNYCPPCAGTYASVTEAIGTMVWSVPGVCTNLRIKLSAAAGGIPPGAGHHEFYLRVNGVDSALSCVFGTADTDQRDTTHAVTLARGDRVSLHKHSGGFANATQVYFTLEFTPTTAGVSVYGGNSAASNPGAGTIHNAVFFPNVWRTLAGTQLMPGQSDVVSIAGALTGLDYQLTTAPGSGKSITFTIYKNGIATAASVTISNLATTGTWSGSVSFAPGDLVYQVASFSGGPSTGTTSWSAAFLASSPGLWMLGSANLGGPSSAAARYFTPNNGDLGYSTVEGDRVLIGPISPTLVSGAIMAIGTAPGSGKSWTTDSRKNSATPSAAPTITISDAATTGTDTVHGMTLVDTDVWAMRATPSGTPATPTPTAWTWIGSPTTAPVDDDEAMLSNDPEVGVIWLKVYDRLGNLHVISNTDLPDREVYHGGFKAGIVTSVGFVDRSVSNRFAGIEVPRLTFKLFDRYGTFRALAADPATADFTGLAIVYHTIPDAGRRAEEEPRTLFRGVTRSHRWEDLTLEFDCEDPLSAEIAANNDVQQIPKRSFPVADFAACGDTKVSSSAGSTYVADGAAIIGATELAVKNGTGQYAAGDKITLPGHAAPYTISRSSNTGKTWQELTAAAELTETRIYLDSALTSAVSNNDVVTQVANHDVPAAVGTSVPFGFNLVSDYNVVGGEDVGDGQMPARYLGDETWADGKTYGVWCDYGHACYSPGGKPIQGIYLFNNAMDLATLAATGKRIACPGYSNWATVGFASSFITRNGNDYTVFGLRGVFRDWALGITPPPPNIGGIPLAVNAYGHDVSGLSTGALLTAGTDIYQFVWKNYFKGDYRSGAPLAAPTFPDDPSVSMLDEQSFDDVKVLQNLRVPGGYVLAFGFGFNGERITYGEAIARLNKSLGVRSRFNHRVQFGITMADDNPITALAHAETLDDINDILDESSYKLGIDNQDLNLANVYRFSHTPDFLGRAAGGWRSALTGFNEVQHDASVAVHGKIYGQPVELFCVRGKNRSSDPDVDQPGSDTADDILKHLLRETSEAPRVYTIPTSMRGANIAFELGQTMFIEHFKNDVGRAARPVLIRRVKINAGSDPDGKVVIFEADDLGRILYQALSITYGVGAADASSSPSIPPSTGPSASLTPASVPVTQTPATTGGITQLTGDVTAGPGSGPQLATIPNDTVTNAKAANMAQSTIKGRAAGAGTGDPTDLTATQATAILNNVVGDSGAGGTKGLVPAPGAGDAAAGKFLKADGTFAVPPGTGTGGNITSTGAVGSEPGSPASGDLYLPNNGVGIERYSGSAWPMWGPLFPFTDPSLQTFAWINQGTATLDTTKGGIYIEDATAGSLQLRLRKKAAPATPYTITTAFIPQVDGVSFSCVAIGFRESSSGKIVAFEFRSSGTTPQLISDKFTSPTVFSAGYANKLVLNGMLVFLRIADDGANRICSWSTDGQHWRVIHTVGRTDFLTADEVWWGLVVNTGIVGGTLMHWKEA